MITIQVRMRAASLRHDVDTVMEADTGRVMRFCRLPHSPR